MIFMGGGDMADSEAAVSSNRSILRFILSRLNGAGHYQTAPEDRISLAHKVIYGFGAFVNNLLAAAIGGMVIILNLGLGMNPALVGLLGALPRLTDAITDPLMGYISDNTHSRDNFYFWYFLIGSFVFYLGYTIFATPWVALGYELTPDYHERTRLMGVQNFMGQFAYIISPWFLAIMQASMFTDMVEGASYLAIAIGILTIGIGILPAIFLRERFSHADQGLGQMSDSEKRASMWEIICENMVEFFKGFITTLKVKPFLMLCAATFLVFNGFMLISSFSFYVIIYYVFGGDTELGAEYAGWAGSVGAVSTFAVIAIVTWMSTTFGKRRAFIVAMLLSIIGYALKWVCYNPKYPWLVLVPAPFMAFGLGGLFTLMGAMIADVCDLDELHTSERREGMFGSIYWWVVKLGMALALAGGGFLLNATGFDVELDGNQTEQAIFLMRFFDAVVPIISTLVAIWLIAKFPITEEKAHEIRRQLEERRGVIPAAD